MYVAITTQLTMSMKTGMVKVGQYTSPACDERHEAVQYAATQFTENIVSHAILDNADHYNGRYTWHMSDSKNTYITHVNVEYV